MKKNATAIASFWSDETIAVYEAAMAKVMLSDDEKGKEQYADGTYHDRKIGDVPVNSQELFYEEAYASVGEN